MRPTASTPADEMVGAGTKPAHHQRQRQRQQVAKTSNKKRATVEISKVVPVTYVDRHPQTGLLRTRVFLVPRKGLSMNELHAAAVDPDGSRLQSAEVQASTLSTRVRR